MAIAIAPFLLAATLPGTSVPATGITADVLDHAVARGDVLGPGDFAIEEVSAAEARNAVSARDAAGMEARRNLNAGSVVRTSDIMPRQLVRRGEPVTIRIVNGTLTIATGGRALAAGARGDLVRVVATATSRTLDGVVDGAGSVRVVVP